MRSSLTRKEQPAMENLFTYGTLRPGCSNADLLELSSASKPRYESATARGLALYLNSSGSFPYARPHPGRSIRGTLVTFTAEQWSKAHPLLDALEGYDPQRPGRGHYLRRPWLIRTDSGRQTLGWIYLCGPRIALRPNQLIRSGDGLEREPSPTRF